MLIYSFTIVYLVRNIALALVPLAVSTAITLEFNWRDRQRQLAAEREAERQQYVTQILNAQEDERRRIAQELHDGAIQELLVIANTAQQAMSYETSTNTAQLEKMKYTRDAALTITEELRRITFNLRPGVLDNLGLVPAVRWLAEKVRKESGIETRVLISGKVRSLTPETELTIFRIVQEALNNVQRHSKATEAKIRLIYSSEFKVAVEDNGTGFPVSGAGSYLAKKNCLGLMGMRQRARSINGNLEISSQVGKGTLVSISVKE